MVCEEEMMKRQHDSKEGASRLRQLILFVVYPLYPFKPSSATSAA